MGGAESLAALAGHRGAGQVQLIVQLRQALAPTTTSEGRPDAFRTACVSGAVHSSPAVASQMALRCGTISAVKSLTRYVRNWIVLIWAHLKSPRILSKAGGAVWGKGGGEESRRLHVQG